LHRTAIADIADECQVAITRIGALVAGRSVDAFDADGHGWQPPRTGFDHFNG
jgi:thiamine-monophosphate kinase